MKTIVSVQEISEFDLKPSEAVAQWRNLVKDEIAQRWRDRSSWIRINWPTCEILQEKPAFERDGFAYVESSTCGSLYASYRPSEDEIWSWYRESNSSKFWRDELLSISKQSRQEKINEPRSDWIADGIAEYKPSATSLLDISTNGRELINLVASKNTGLKRIVMAGMTADLEGEATPMIGVEPTKISYLSKHGSVDVIVAIDILDRVADVSLLISALDETLAPGGIAFITSPVSSGFEVQTLWGESTTIQPPDKLNIPSVRGLQLLFPASKWEILELSTPGMFDVELVRRAIIENPNNSWPRIVRSLVEETDANGKMALVELLQSQLMSSFSRLVIKRIK
jgi:hypothetical protein